MNWMIYGANGYTGSLIAAEAVARGMRPTLAGRDRDAVTSLAARLGLPARIFALVGETELNAQVGDQRLVLHCAGPFSTTSAPMLAACLSGGAHYVDITGEIEVFEHAWRQRVAAEQADVAICPGAGFDVVPTDCLAASLVRALPAATRLTLAFEAGGGLSPGTARTSVEGLGKGGRVRKDGELMKVPVAWKTRLIPFPHGDRTAVTIPWGDVFTAWVSTGVPDIEVYLSVPPDTLKKMFWARRLRWLLGLPWVQSWLKGRVERNVRGPDEHQRAESSTCVWGEARSADGRVATGTLRGPNGYDLTVTASLGIVQHLLANRVAGGFYTPSLLMGPDYAAGLPGVGMSLSADP